MQTIYILIALKQADYVAQVYLGMEKGVQLPKKNCEIADLEKYSLGNLCRLYGTKENLIMCEKRCEFA